jgi:hypothetical protein
MNGPVLESYLAAVVQWYPEALPAADTAAVLLELTEATGPPDLPDFVKDVAFEHLAGLARLLGAAPTTTVRAALTHRNAALEPARSTSFQGEGAHDVRLSLLRLKQVLGCVLLPEEWVMLLRAMGPGAGEQRLRRAVEVAAEVLHRGEHVPELQTLLTVHLEHPSPYVRGAAMASALYGGELDRKELTLLSQRLLERARQDHPYVIQTFLAQLAFQDETRRGPHRETILAVARQHEQSTHAGVRARAPDLVRLSEDDLVVLQR